MAVLLVVGSVDEGDPLLSSEAGEEVLRSCRGLQLGAVVTGELVPAGRIVPEPLA